MNRVRQLGQMLCVSAFVLCMSAVSAFAAASPTTGIDYQADLATPILNEVKLPVLAAMAVLVFFIAISGGKKLWGRVTGVRG